MCENVQINSPQCKNASEYWQQHALSSENRQLHKDDKQHCLLLNHAMHVITSRLYSELVCMIFHTCLPAFQMAHIQFTDTLVREYLVSRGFATALKSFDADVKSSKDHSFRVSCEFFGSL